MPTIHFTELKTERLLLRQLQSADWKIISFLRTDSSVNQFVKRPPAETKEYPFTSVNRFFNDKILAKKNK